jgi:chaperonin GroEL (HSP60 family)
MFQDCSNNTYLWHFYIAMKTRITNAKIACLDIDLRKQRMHLGIQLQADDPEQLEAMRKRLASIRFLDLVPSDRSNWMLSENPKSSLNVSERFLQREQTSS